MGVLDELRTGILSTAQQLGVDPLDIATVISYETGGRMDPNIKGPTTKWGQHRGLLQWGEPQAQKYLGGDFSVPSQMKGAVSYLTDAGVKPGMGLLDIYSAVNAGRVGRYGASDAAAGGAPGTVADKVAGMSGHRKNAEKLLAGTALGGGVTGAQPDMPPMLAEGGHAAAPGKSGSKIDSMLMSGLLGGSSAPKAPEVRFDRMRDNKSPFPALAQYVAEYMKNLNGGSA
jgi:hypothetical protein